MPPKPGATGLRRLAWRWLAPIAFGAGGASLLVAGLFLLLPVEPWRPLADRLLGWLFGWCVPSIPAMGLGICMAPLLCLALLVVLAMCCEEHAPRPWSVPVFLGCEVAMFCGDGEFATRALLAGGIATLAAGVEVLLRGLRAHWRSVLCMFGIWVSEISFAWAAVASSGV